MAQTSVRFAIRGDINPIPERREFFPFEVQLTDGAKVEAAIELAKILKGDSRVKNLFIWEFVTQTEA